MANPKHSVQVGPRGVIVKGIFVLTIILLLVKSSFVQRYSTYIYANHPALLFDGETTDETSINMRELTFTDFGISPLLVVTARTRPPVSLPMRWSTIRGTMHQNPDPHRPIVALMDIQTCGKTRWRNMNHCSALEENSNLRNNRTALTDFTDSDVCGKIEQALSSPAMIALGSQLAALHCQPGDHRGWGVVCGGGSWNGTIFDKLDVPAQTKYKTEGIASQDMGLSPLPVKPVALNASDEIDDILSCRLDNRTRLLPEQQSQSRLPTDSDELNSPSPMQSL